MSDPTKSPFVFEGAALLASALHAQLLARRRPTFEHDLKNVMHGLLSGTELLSKALATNSPRIPPADCLALLRQQLSRVQETLQRMLAEIAPPDAQASDFDLAELLEECMRDLRHELQRYELEAAIESQLSVHAQRPHLKSGVLAALLESMDRAPPSSKLSVTARREGDGVALAIRHASPDTMPSATLVVVGEMLRPDDIRMEVALAGAERQITLSLPRGTSPPASAHRLLIVDANRDAADSLTMLVQLEGFEAQAAYDMESAVQCVRKQMPNAIVVDVDGSIDSAALIARLRMQEHATARIIGLSHSPESRSASLDAQLRKPLDPAALRTVLTQSR